MLSIQYKKLLEYEALSKQETLLLISDVQRGDSTAAWKLVIKNTKLVLKILHRHFHKHINDDAFSDGLYGLYVAITRLDNSGSFGRFLRYSVMYIKGYIIKGIERRKTQLSPSRVEFGHFNRIEISKEKALEENNENIFEFYGINESPYFGPYETTCRNDKNKFLNMIISNSCRNPTQNKVFGLLMENDGDCAQVAKCLKTTRQYIHAVKNQIRNNAKWYLLKNKNIAKELKNIY